MSSCRSCGSSDLAVFADLGLSPLANSYVSKESANEPETFWPLKALVCRSCFLVQLEVVPPPEVLFSDYAYLSSVSQSWLHHARDFVETTTAELSLSDASQVIEIASNDGYLLKYFVEKGIPSLGIEPARNVASIAVDRGVPTVVDFFTADLASELASNRRADLVIANNVLAHVPDLHDFVEGIRLLLSREGRATLEFPHLLQLIVRGEYDTIYHEHVTYLSLVALIPVLTSHGLRPADVEILPTHGGSLRLHVVHAGSSIPQTARLEHLIEDEKRSGLMNMHTYSSFNVRVPALKRAVVRALHDIVDRGETLGGYGAPAKASTLLNYCGISRDVLPFVVDANSNKQGRFIPGTRIPIEGPEAIEKQKPKRIWILPWNLSSEIAAQLSSSAQWGARFFVCDPEPRLL